MIKIIFTILTLVGGFSSEAVTQTLLTNDQSFPVAPNRALRANEMLAVEVYDDHYIVGVAEGHSGPLINLECESIRVEAREGAELGEKLYRSTYLTASIKDNSWDSCLPEHCRGNTYENALSCVTTIHKAMRLKELAEIRNNLKISCMYNNVHKIQNNIQLAIIEKYCDKEASKYVEITE